MKFRLETAGKCVRLLVGNKTSDCFCKHQHVWMYRVFIKSPFKYNIFHTLLHSFNYMQLNYPLQPLVIKSNEEVNSP